MNTRRRPGKKERAAEALARKAEQPATVNFRYRFEDGSTMDSPVQDVVADLMKQAASYRRLAEAEADPIEALSLQVAAQKIEDSIKADIGRIALVAHRQAVKQATLINQGAEGRRKVAVLARRYPDDAQLLAALKGHRDRHADEKLRSGAMGDIYLGWMTRAARAEGIKVEAISKAWSRLNKP